MRAPESLLLAGAALMENAPSPQDCGGFFSYILLMRKQATVPVLIFLILLAGCVNSLHPLYTEQDLIFDPALLGQWIAGKETWIVTRQGEKTYSVVNTDEKGEKAIFVGHLLRVGGTMFVDLFPVGPALHDTLRVHTFYLVLRTEPTPQFGWLDGNWLKKYLEKNPDSLRHERFGEEILITASSKDLQRFLLSHLKTEGAFVTNEPWRAQDTLTPWSF